MTGKFFVIEGCEGAGKSYQTKAVAAALCELGYHTVYTREPGGTPFAEKVRSLLSDPKNELDGMSELLLFSAARNRHVAEFIVPNLESGVNVVCDRFVYSTLAYQGYARNVDLSFVREVNGAVTKGLIVSGAYFLNLPPEKAFSRKGGADKADRVENESIDFFTKVYNGFIELVNNGELTPIDCSGEKAQTTANLVSLIVKELEK